jgi:putative ABC transport system permease protein
MENLEEYATLKALGATRGFVARVVIMESLICGVGGTILGLIAVIPTMRYARSLIPWINTPSWLPVIVMVLSLLMCSLASMASVRSSLSVDPGRVFRA